MDTNRQIELTVRDNFDRQPFMAAIGARLARVAHGEVDITLPFDRGLTQQNGFLHAAVVTAILDSACGYAALSVMPPGSDVLSVEFKVNLLAPATGESFVARARTVRAGRTIVVCQADCFSSHDGKETLVAVMTGTMIRSRSTADGREESRA
jgi:uncharacterized protein (TIGR00369 family)